MARRIRTTCNRCLGPMLAAPFDAQGEGTRCALCLCYVDGLLTIEEAIQHTMREQNLSRPRAEAYRAEWLKAEGTVSCPNGFTERN